MAAGQLWDELRRRPAPGEAAGSELLTRAEAAGSGGAGSGGAGKGGSDGSLWWLDREFDEAKKYMGPKQLAKAEKARADAKLAEEAA